MLVNKHGAELQNASQRWPVAAWLLPAFVLALGAGFMALMLWFR
jgi:hypothetical protein